MGPVVRVVQHLSFTTETNEKVQGDGASQEHGPDERQPVECASVRVPQIRLPGGVAPHVGDPANAPGHGEGGGHERMPDTGDGVAKDKGRIGLQGILVAPLHAVELPGLGVRMGRVHVRVEHPELPPRPHHL